MVVGKWDRSVIVSYLGVAISCVGMYFAISTHRHDYACVCLILAGICDMLDGFVARSIKHRSTADKQFGIELDSVADVVDFIALPIVIVCTLGVVDWYEIIPLIIFAICGVARLAYFNTTAIKTDGPVKIYHGLPVTFTSVILPIMFLIFSLFVPSVLKEMLLITMLLIAILNVLDVYIPKPKPKHYPIFILLAIVAVTLLLVAL